MKRIKLLTVAALCIALVSVFFVACNDGNTQKGGDTPGAETEYNITVVQSDVCTVTPDVTKAKEGDEVTVTVTLTNEDAYIDGVKFNDYDCEKTATGYKFTMPASDVTLTAVTGTRTEVKQNGIATFADANITTVPVNGTSNQSLVGFEDKVWCFEVNFDASYMATLKSEIKSSDQSVIPDTAITVKSYSKADLHIGGANDFEIVKARVFIDTSVISEGITWLTMNFVNGNSSSQKGNLAIKVNVCGYGELEIEKMSETLTIDVSAVGEPDAVYTVRITDEDFMKGTTAGEYAGANHTLTAVDGKITLTFDYSVGHNYNVRVTEGPNDDYLTSLRISGHVISGASYTGDEEYAGSGNLTFTLPGCNLELTVYTE